jgi:hypothetical protein
MTGAVDAMTEELQAIRKELTDSRRQGAKIIGGFLVAIALLGALVYATNQTSTTANEAAAAIVANRDTARVASCQQDNRRIQQSDDVISSTEAVLRSLAVPAPGETAERVAATAAFVNTYIARFEKDRVALRDCTPAGISKYLATPGTG